MKHERALSLVLVALTVVGLSACGGDAEHPPGAAEHKEATAPMEGAAEPGFSIDPRRQQMIGVTYASVERRDIEQTVRTVGVVEYDERLLTDVSLKFSGWIENLYVDETGALVEKGEVLLDLYSPELVTTQQEFLTVWDHFQRLKASGNAEAVKLTGYLLEATEQRLDYWDIAPKHVADLKTDRRVLRALPIHSPASGFVIEKNVVVGTHMTAGKLLYRLAGLETVWVLADVYEYELSNVSVGQRVRVTLAYLAGEVFTGRIAYIYPYLETGERTVKVRVELANPGYRLKQGMYADVEFSSKRSQVLLVPTAAVLDSGVRQVVFLARAEGRFEPREITIGDRFDEFLEVLEGLEEGDRIVASSNFLLDSESQLLSGMKQMEH